MVTKIGIIGLGLIGGSIQKALQSNSDYEILTVSKSQNSPYQIKDLESCDIIFLCGQQSTILKQLEEIALITSKSSAEGTIPESQRAFGQTLITDIASTKSYITAKSTELGLVNFVPGHPMAGTEHKGYESSFPELFQKAKWILCPTNQNFRLEKKLKILEDIITKTLGAELILIDPDTHDRLVAISSHLPLTLSLGLGQLVNLIPGTQSVLGPGSKGMMRLANGNTELSKEIITINKSKIKDSWELFKTEVDNLLDLDSATLEQELESIKGKVQNCL